jgi:phage gpG-like protein
MTLTLEPTDRAQWERTAAKIRGMRERAQDVSPAWQAVITWFAIQNALQWATRGQRYKTPWRPLSPATLHEKARLGYPPDPLVRTKTLRTSLTVRPLDVEHVTPHEMAAGTNTRYARFHQVGTRRGLPRRPLFSATQIRREQAVTSAIANWIISGEQKVGGRTVARGGR